MYHRKKLKCDFTKFLLTVLFSFIFVSIYIIILPQNETSLQLNDKIDIDRGYAVNAKYENLSVVDNYILKDPEGQVISKLPAEKSLVVPNVVHYAWFGENELFNFYHFLGLKSVFQNLQPEVVKFHCDFHPIGHWWKRMRELVATRGEWNFKIVQRSAPVEIFGTDITRLNHKQEIAALQILMEEGGIYIEQDVIVLKSFEPLRKFNFTMGLEYYGDPGRLNNGVILAHRDAAFLKLWYNGYQDFKKAEWDQHSAQLPYKMMYHFPELVHVEEKTINYPSGKDLHLIYEEKYDWSQNYAIHIWQELYDFVSSPATIEKSNTTFGEIARKIYFDN